MTKWDKVTIILYIAISFILFWYYNLNTTELVLKRDILLSYIIGTHLFLYFFNYKSLRNFKVFLIWFGFGIIHLIIFFKLKEANSLQNLSEYATSGFGNTIPLLILFQILRIVNLKIQGQELVATNTMMATDLFDNRMPNALDFFSLIIYLLAMYYLPSCFV